MKSIKIFVYGTLKKGYALNNELRDSKFIGNGIIKGYKMYSNGYFPMITKGDKSNAVTGEIYEVSDEETLRVLDMIEGAYIRTKEKALLTNGQKIDVEVYVYRYLINDCQKIKTGEWTRN